MKTKYIILGLIGIMLVAGAIAGTWQITLDTDQETKIADIATTKATSQDAIVQDIIDSGLAEYEAEEIKQNYEESMANLRDCARKLECIKEANSQLKTLVAQKTK